MNCGLPHVSRPDADQAGADASPQVLPRLGSCCLNLDKDVQPAFSEACELAEVPLGE